MMCLYVVVFCSRALLLLMLPIGVVRRVSWLHVAVLSIDGLYVVGMCCSRVFGVACMVDRRVYMLLCSCVRAFCCCCYDRSMFYMVFFLFARSAVAFIVDRRVYALLFVFLFARLWCAFGFRLLFYMMCYVRCSRACVVHLIVGRCFIGCDLLFVFGVCCLCDRGALGVCALVMVVRLSVFAVMSSVRWQATPTLLLLFSVSLDMFVIVFACRSMRLLVLLTRAAGRTAYRQVRAKTIARSDYQ